jgi:putative glutamine amidotransferase
VDPTRYGEERSLSCGDTQKYRDEVEFKVLALALQSGKPILAICRGMQLLNVALGGTLIQDLPTEWQKEIAHKQTHSLQCYTHEVCIHENTPLHALMGKAKMQVNSLHHQAIECLGEGLRVMATADDGIVEAVYMPDKRYLRAYQWHPECLVQTCEDNYNIVQDFLNACMGA